MQSYPQIDWSAEEIYSRCKLDVRFTVDVRMVKIPVISYYLMVHIVIAVLAKEETWLWLPGCRRALMFYKQSLDNV